MYNSIKRFYIGAKAKLSNNRLLDYWWFFEQEINSWNHWVKLPIRHRLWLWRNGFTSPTGKLYDFENNSSESYLSELQRKRFYQHLNGRHRYLLDDKLSQHWMLSDYPENRPEAYGIIDRGYVHRVTGTVSNSEPILVSDWLPMTLRNESKLVLKQLRGTGGKEVVICEYDNGFLLDGQEISESEFCNQVETYSGYLVTEYVQQHQYAQNLYPDTPNTIRLFTLWDDKSEELIFPIAIHRIGTDCSQTVDNWSSGGLSVEIDIETGELGQAAQFPFSGEVPWYDNHPDTGVQIKGTEIPNWNGICSTVEKIALNNTNIPAVGWDIIVNDSGNPIIIEANTGSDVQLLQVHRPLLEDGRVATVASRYL